MQKFNRINAPNELTAEVKEELTKKYCSDGSNVWAKPFIKASLFSMTSGKCIYCECSVGEESKYLEVEHFKDKSNYPELVIEWSNLLPSCKRCNGRKSNHDVGVYPIVDPASEDPRDHLIFHNYRYLGSTSKGERTVDVVCLNDAERLVLTRFKIGNKVLELMESLTFDVGEFSAVEGSVRQRNKLVDRILALFKLGRKSEEFCSTVATVLVSNGGLEKLKDNAERAGLWNSEMETIYLELKEICYL